MKFCQLILPVCLLSVVLLFACNNGDGTSSTNPSIDIYIWRPSDIGQATCNSQEYPEFYGFTMAHASAGNKIYVKRYGTNGKVYNSEIALR